MLRKPTTFNATPILPKLFVYMPIPMKIRSLNYLFYLVFAMSTGIEAAVVTRPEIILLTK
jgi:hypothetical protein